MSAKSRIAAQRFGRNVARWREERGLSQDRLAKASRLTRLSLGVLERGERTPSFRTITALAAALGISEGDLFGDAAVALATAPAVSGSRLLWQTIQRRGTYLAATELKRLGGYLAIHLSLPFVSDLSGEAAEILVARARGATRIEKRANRPEADYVLRGLNYSLKTERLTRKTRMRDALGEREDLIYTRIPIGDIAGRGPGKLGRAVITSYNINTVRKYSWSRISVLLRSSKNEEFLYFEEDAVEYDPADYKWDWVSRGARVSATNIAAVDRATRRQKFRWNAGTTLLYVVHDIPKDADIFRIRRRILGIEDLRKAFFT